jgi:pimeloyl-ACP methyl ester carboxylesterase
VQKALEWDKSTIIGHSLGAGVATLVIASFPERVSSCVMIDGLGPFTLSAKAAHTHLRRSVESRASLQGKSQRVCTYTL